jgi:hypothetical protein
LFIHHFVAQPIVILCGQILCEHSSEQYQHHYGFVQTTVRARIHFFFLIFHASYLETQNQDFTFVSSSRRKHIAESIYKEAMREQAQRSASNPSAKGRKWC